MRNLLTVSELVALGDDRHMEQDVWELQVHIILRVCFKLNCTGQGQIPGTVPELERSDGL
jgi:hypothetical protein